MVTPLLDLFLSLPVPSRYDAYFDAIVFGYDATRKLHGCEYTSGADAGDKQWHDLTRKRLQVTGRKSLPQQQQQQQQQSMASAATRTSSSAPSSSTDLGPGSGDGASNHGSAGVGSRPEVGDDNEGHDGSNGGNSGASETGFPKVKMPPSIFGVRPSSSGNGRSGAGSASGGGAAAARASREREAAVKESLRASPYHADPALRGSRQGIHGTGSEML